MEQNSLDIRITHDPSGQRVNLEGMSFKVLALLKNMLNAMMEIAETEPDAGWEVSLRNASVGIKLQAPPTAFAILATFFENELNSPFARIEHMESNPASYLRSMLMLKDGHSPELHNKRAKCVKALNAIRTLVHANGFRYEAKLKSNGVQVDVTQRFRSTTPFKVAQNKAPRTAQLRFFEGKLNEVGGKRPNFHLETPGETITIRCSEEQAKGLTGKLYERLLVSAWVERGSGALPQYHLCDTYDSHATLVQLRTFVDEVGRGEDTEPLEAVHRFLRECLLEDRFELAARAIRLFLHAKFGAPFWRMILIACKPFRRDVRIHDLVAEAERLLSEKLGKPVL